MILDNNIAPFIIFHEESILSALQRISDNKLGILFAINEKAKLQGVLSDGDVRRWLIGSSNVDLTKSISTILNRQFVACNILDSKEYIRGRFNSKANIRYIPLVDDNFHLVAVARLDSPGFRLGEVKIAEDERAFIIAEIGNNHNGDINLAKKLVSLAKDSGADCVKFQMRDLKTLYNNSGDSNDIAEDLGSQYVLDLLERFQLEKSEMFEVFDYCKELDILPLCTPWDEESLSRLEEYGMLGYKVASADLTNHDFLLKLVKTGKPLIVSTGMCSEGEIIESVELLRKNGGNFALLHCNSAYPAPFKDIHLNYLSRLKELSGGVVGYSGHERGIFVAVAAVAKGAKIVEKHFTIDKSFEGNDHKVSLLPDEFREMVSGIRQVEESMGGFFKQMSQGELMNRENLAKSLCVNKDLEIGELITEDMLEVRSPGKGLQPNKKKEVIGKILNRKLKKGDILYPSDIKRDIAVAREYEFPRDWGVPVRYHDFRSLVSKTNLKLIEFHLSYKDLDEDLSKFFTEKENLPYKLVVHAPELFRGDHILDLCAEDEAYRAHSILEMQRVVNVTKELQRFFNQKNTPIITNVGGFNSKGFIPKKRRKKLYELFLDSLSKIDTRYVEIVPQTMPPYPWHFGGQSHHNLFVDPDEIVEVCSQHSLSICLDVSHSQLACNYYDWSLGDFIQKVGPFVSHLHIADARGVDGEGLQIGDGDMDFKHLCDLIIRHTPSKATFIPEVWQGHKNSGEGFWHAFEKLEQYFRGYK